MLPRPQNTGAHNQPGPAPYQESGQKEQAAPAGKYLSSGVSRPDLSDFRKTVRERAITNFRAMAVSLSRQENPPCLIPEHQKLRLYRMPPEMKKEDPELFNLANALGESVYLFETRVQDANRELRSIQQCFLSNPSEAQLKDFTHQFYHYLPGSPIMRQRRWTYIIGGGAGSHNKFFGSSPLPCSFKTLLTFISTTLNYCRKNNIDRVIPWFLIFDLYLSCEATGNPCLLLNLPVTHFARLLDCAEQLDKQAVSFWSQSSLTNEGDNSTFNYIAWAEGKGSVICNNTGLQSLEAVRTFQLKKWIPHTIQQLLFLPARSSRFNPPELDKNQLLFGEEFEFSLTSKDSDGKYRNYDQTESAWVESMCSLAKALKLNEYSFERSCCETMFTIDTWSYVIFLDQDVVEVNISPYSQNQRFEITSDEKKQQLTTPELADRFIFPVVRELGLTGYSGHKHIDVAVSFQGNVELLFRLVVDMETNSWLPRVLGRETRISAFPYSSQDAVKCERITSMVQAANSCIAEHALPKTGDYSDILSLKSFLNGIEMSGKRSACALHHLSNFKRTSTVDIPPSTTVELRQFHCPFNGAEVDFINRLILGRLDFLIGCQKRREPINYHSVDPASYDASHDEKVLRLYAQYLQECNLTPADGKTLLAHSQISKQLLDQFFCVAETHTSSSHEREISFRGDGKDIAMVKTEMA